MAESLPEPAGCLEPIRSRFHFCPYPTLHHSRQSACALGSRSQCGRPGKSLQTGIARHADEVEDITLSLAPSNDLLARKARIGPHNDFHARQTLANSSNDLQEVAAFYSGSQVK